MPTYFNSAPVVMKDQSAMERFVRELDAASDLVTLANACAGIASHALHEHLVRHGKDNHAAAALELAQYLEQSTSQMRAIWLRVEGKG
jgi:ribosomal protein S15P/S13E